QYVRQANSWGREGDLSPRTGGLGRDGDRCRDRERRADPAVVIVRAMTRIPYVRREELGPEGQQLWDGIVSGQGDRLLTAEGGLAGPFNALVTVPGAGRR